MGNKDMRVAGAVTFKNLICLWDLHELIKDIIKNLLTLLKIL